MVFVKQVLAVPSLPGHLFSINRWRNDERNGWNEWNVVDGIVVQYGSR
jgi:hypothetical protein